MGDTASMKIVAKPMKHSSPPVFIFVGHSGSGKTTLVEKLLAELTSRGLRPATNFKLNYRNEKPHLIPES